MNPHQESIRRNLREVEDLLRDLPEDWQEPASEAIVDLERVRNSVRHMADTIDSLGEELGRRSSEVERLRELSGDAGKLREERDEARREICLLRASSTNATEKVSAELEQYAQSRGWTDLFAEDR